WRESEVAIETEDLARQARPDVALELRDQRLHRLSHLLLVDLPVGLEVGLTVVLLEAAKEPQRRLGPPRKARSNLHSHFSLHGFLLAPKSRRRFRCIVTFHWHGLSTPCLERLRDPQRRLLGAPRLDMGREAVMGGAAAAAARHRPALSSLGPGLGSARRRGGRVLGGGGGPLPDGVRREPDCVHRALRDGRHLPDPRARHRRSRVSRAAAPQGLDDGTAAEPASALVRLVASTDPNRISEKPTTAPRVKGSCSRATPNTRATAGLK